MSDGVDWITESALFDRIARHSTALADRLTPNNESLFIFGSNAGKYYGDNSRYLFEWALRNESEIDSVWMTKSDDVSDRLRSENKPVASINSRKGVSTLLRADTAFFTHSTADIAPDTKLVPESLTLVNLRHGESVKNTHLCPNNDELVSEKKRDQSRRWRRRNVKIASTSRYIADVQERCLGVASDQPMVTGYPRHDPLWSGHGDNPQDTLEEFLDLDVDTSERIALYAPTWRQYAPARDEEYYTQFFPFDRFDPEELSSILEVQDTRLLLRPHPHDLKHDEVVQFLERVERAIPNVTVAGPDVLNDVYEIITAVDVLVTDYSSLYHDYLVLDRPIILVPYDYDVFEEEIGFVYDYEEKAPGPRPETWPEFKRHLERSLSGDDRYGDRRETLRDLVYDHRDGESCRRVMDNLR